MWNAERPRYLDILLFRQDLRNCRDVFPVFSFEQGLCWKLVTGPAWIAISLVSSLMASSSTGQLPFLKRMQACPPIKSAFTLCFKNVERTLGIGLRFIISSKKHKDFP